MQGIIVSIDKQELTTLMQDAIHSVLTDLGLTKAEPEKQEDLMSASDVCKWLDMKMATLYMKTHREEIPFFKKGKRIYFSREALNAWVSEGKRYTKAEQNQLADERLLSVNKHRTHKKH